LPFLIYYPQFPVFSASLCVNKRLWVMAKKVYTIRQVAELFNEPQYRINYVVDKQQITPAARVANIRLFDDVAIEQIKEYFMAQQIAEDLKGMANEGLLRQNSN